MKTLVCQHGYKIRTQCPKGCPKEADWRRCTRQTFPGCGCGGYHLLLAAENTTREEAQS